MWPFSDRKKEQTGHTLDDSDRQASLDKRRMQRERANLQWQIEKTRMEQELEDMQAELQELRSVSDDAPADAGPMDMQSMMMMLLMQQMQGGTAGGVLAQTPPSQPQQSSPPASSLISYTDEQIADMIGQMSKMQRMMAKRVPDELLRVKMREMFNADDDSIERAIVKLRS